MILQKTFFNKKSFQQKNIFITEKILLKFFFTYYIIYYPDNIFWILVTKIEPSRRFFEGKSRLSPHLTYTSHYYNSIIFHTKTFNSLSKRAH